MEWSGVEWMEGECLLAYFCSCLSYLSSSSSVKMLCVVTQSWWSVESSWSPPRMNLTLSHGSEGVMGSEEGEGEWGGREGEWGGREGGRGEGEGGREGGREREWREGGRREEGREGREGRERKGDHNVHTYPT